MRIVVLLRVASGGEPAAATRATIDALGATLLAGPAWQDLAEEAALLAPAWLVLLQDDETIPAADAAALARFLADEALPGIAYSLDGPGGDPVVRVLPSPLTASLDDALSGAGPVVGLDVALDAPGAPTRVGRAKRTGVVRRLDVVPIDPEAPALTVVVVGTDARLVERTVTAVRGQPCSEPVEVVRAAAAANGLARATGDAVLLLRAGDTPAPGALEARIGLHDRGHRVVGGPVRPASDRVAARIWAAVEHPLGDARRPAMTGPLAAAGASWARDAAPGPRGPIGRHDPAVVTVVHGPDGWLALLRTHLRRGAALARQAHDADDLERRLRVRRVGALLGDRHRTVPGQRPAVPRPALRAARTVERVGAWLECRR